MNVVFLISHTPNPRINKRIFEASKNNTVSIIYWDKVTVDFWKEFHKDVTYKKISIKANYTNPIKRVFPYIRFGKIALKLLKELKPNIIYTENLDMLLIATRYKQENKIQSFKIYYEIADLNRLILNNQKSLFLKLIQKSLIFLEKKNLKHVDKLILTSPKFFDNYYNKFIDINKTLIINNIPDPHYFLNYRKKDSGNFTIGFIGAIRYFNQINLLLNAALLTNTNALLAGQSISHEIYKSLEKNSNIEILGRYDYENEIGLLYSKIDCVFAVYDTLFENVKIALPNKLFEAIYCRLPIIVSKNTYLAEVVEKYNIGISINPNSIQELIEAILRLKNDKSLSKMFSNNCSIAEKDFNFENEQKKHSDLFLNLSL